MTNNMNLQVYGKREMAEKCMQVITKRFTELSRLAELKEQLKDNQEAINLVNNTKLDLKGEHSIDKFIKNYSTVKLIKRCEIEIEKLNIVMALNKVLEEMLPKPEPEKLESKKSESKKLEDKLFKALVDNKVFYSIDNETKSQFIKRLRKEGHKVSDRKVKESEIFNFIRTATKCKSNDWAYITTIEDCKGYNKEGEQYITRKIKEQKERSKKGN